MLKKMLKDSECDAYKTEHKPLSEEMKQAVSDSRNRTNLNGPYKSAEEAVRAMLDE